MIHIFRGKFQWLFQYLPNGKWERRYNKPALLLPNHFVVSWENVSPNRNGKDRHEALGIPVGNLRAVNNSDAQNRLQISPTTNTVTHCWSLSTLQVPKES